MSDWPQSPDASPPALSDAPASPFAAHAAQPAPTSAVTSPAAPATAPGRGGAAGSQPTLTRADVAHLAGLVRIEATDAELDRLVGQLGVILDSVARVGEVAAADVPPMSHPLPLTNVTRPDEPVPGLSAHDALAAAPASEQQRFRVPRILEED